MSPFSNAGRHLSLSGFPRRGGSVRLAPGRGSPASFKTTTAAIAPREAHDDGFLANAAATTHGPPSGPRRGGRAGVRSPRRGTRGRGRTEGERLLRVRPD